MLTHVLGIIDAPIFCEAVQMARQGLEVPMVPVLRTFGLEFWLKGIRDFGIEARVTGLPVQARESTEAFSICGKANFVE
jgi:hypothetical protein